MLAGCLIEIIHYGVTGVDLAHAADEAAVEKHPFRRRCFSRVNVRHDTNVADLPAIAGEMITWLRCGKGSVTRD